MKKNTNKSFLLIHPIPWMFDLKFLTNQAVELSKFANVIYYYPQQEAVNIYKFNDKKNDIATLLNSFQSYLKPLTVFVPFTIIPLVRFAFVRKLNAALMRGLLKFLFRAKSVGRESFIYTTFPHAVSYISLFTADKIIYDCVDIPRSGVSAADNRMMLKNHRALTRQADIVFVNSSALRSLCVRYNPNVYIIPSGYPYDELRRHGKPVLPGILSEIPKPYAGFIGLTFVHLDIDLLIAVAKKCPFVSFIFIGPTFGLTPLSNTSTTDYARYKTNWKKLILLPNVYHMGRLNKKRLSACISAFDVCMIPYNTQQKSALYANAIKAYEYLFFGKRIVSTSLKPLKSLSSYISFADTPSEFSKMILYSIRIPVTKQEHDRRINMALSHDVSHKIAAFLSILDSYE